jgi:hypothetical protein
VGTAVAAWEAAERAGEGGRHLGGGRGII